MIMFLNSMQIYGEHFNPANLFTIKSLFKININNTYLLWEPNINIIFVLSKSYNLSTQVLVSRLQPTLYSNFIYNNKNPI